MARREMRHYGWGDPAHVSHGLPAGRGRDAARARGPGGRAAASGDATSACRSLRRSTSPGRAPTTRCGCCARPASRIRTWCGCGSARSSTRPTRSSCRARSTSCARSCAPAWPWCRSAAGPAWWVESRRCAGRIRPSSSLDLGELDRLVSLDERSHIAVFEPGIQLPGGGGRAQRSRLHARAFPAELRVRHRRRLRGDALVRPGEHRLRADRDDGGRAARRLPGGRCGAADGTGERRRAGPARALRRLRGRARGPDADRTARAPAAGRAPLRGLHVRVLRAGRRGAPRAGAGGRRAARRAAQRRARDRGDVRAGRPRGARRRPRGALPARTRRRARLPGDLRLGGNAGFGRGQA